MGDKTSKLEALIKEIEVLLYKEKGLDRAEAKAGEAIREIITSQLEDSVQAAWVYTLTTEVKIEIGKYLEAEHFAFKAFEVLKDSAENRLKGRVQWCIGRVYKNLGDMDKARIYLEDSRSTYRTIGYKQGELEALNGLIHLDFIGSDWSSAKKRLRYAYRLNEESGDQRGMALCLTNLATVLRHTAEHNAAEKALKESIQIKEKLGDPLLLTHSWISLARLYLRERRWSQASRLIQRAKKVSQEHNLPRELAMSLESEGELHFERKEYAKAKGSYLEALKIGREISPEGDVVAELCRKLADLYAATRDPDKAIEYGQKALEVSTKLGDGFEQGCSHRALAMGYNLKGMNDKAQEGFAKAVTIFRGIGEKFELGRTLLEQGRFAACALKVRERGLKLLQEAHRLFTEIGPECRYYCGLAKLQMAKAEMLFSHPDVAQNFISEAETIFVDLNDKERLKDTAELRLEIESRFCKATESEENPYLLLKELSLKPPSEAGLRGHLKRLLHTIAERVRADQGFVAYKEADDLKVAERVRLREQEAEKALRLLATNSLEPGELLVKLSAAGRFSSLNARNLLVMPLGLKGRLDGILYLAQKPGRIGWRKEDVQFFVAASEHIHRIVADLRVEGLEAENLVLRAYQTADTYGFPRLITADRKMKAVFRIVDKIKDALGVILLIGESGTGKEIIAKLSHYSSQRALGPFVTVDCASMTDSLLEDELYGHIKGAFTGATRERRGKFEEANGGSIFLDEISTLKPDLQAKLLRVLEQGEVQRRGENRWRKVDVRVIAATNKNLEAEVRAGRFREDVFYRLNCFPIEIPPLRQRKGDIPLLVEHFIRESCSENGGKQIKGVAPEAMEKLMEYDFPGNVRELRNLIKRAVVLADGDMITPDLVNPEIGK